MILVDFEQYEKTLPFVTSKEIYINGNTDKFHPEGLYSEIIFGPKNAYKCTCGAISGREYEGETCELCGVTCVDGTQRSKRYAKIKLQKKILLPIFKKAIQAVFGIKSVKDIFNQMKYASNLTDPYYYDLVQMTLRKRKAIKNLDSTIFKDLPVYDIASLNNLYDFMRNDNTLRLILEKVINKNFLSLVFTNEIIVHPPSSRPIINTGSKKDIPDLSKCYKNLLALSTSTFWENPIKTEEEFNKNIYYFQKIVDELFDLILSKNFLDKTSNMRDAFSGSTVEFSTRAVIVPEPAIKPYSISLSRDAVLKTTMPNFLHFVHKKSEKLKNIHNSQMGNELDVHHLVQMVRSGNSKFKIPDDIFEEYCKSPYILQKFMIERAPVLWRFNFSGVFLESVLSENDGYELFKDIYNDPSYVGPRLSNTKVYNNKIMKVNTTVSSAFNFDFDGDAMSGFALHSDQALRDWQYAFLGNGSNIEFEHNDSLIPTPEHEAVYALWALTFAVKDFIPSTVINLEDIKSLSEFWVSFKILSNAPNTQIAIWDTEGDNFIEVEEDGKLVTKAFIILPYSIAAINKSIGYNIFKSNPGEQPKKGAKELVKKILKHFGKDKFYGPFHEMNKFLLWCSTVVGYCNPTFDLKDFAVGSQEISDYKDTLINEPFIGFHQNDILFTDFVKEEIGRDPENSLYRVFRSDARIKSVQLLKAASNNGIPTDINGKAFINNIKEDLLTGHTKEGFFQSGDSARLALAQRQEAIPKGGELQRRFYFILGFLKLSRTHDCGSKRTFPIEIISKDHLNTLNKRFFIDEAGALKHLDLEKDKSLHLIGKTLNFRFPGGCEHSGYKICDCCFGTKQPQSANLGAAVGSYISESIIQSVLRTHHFSGAFITNIRKDIIELIKRNRFQSPNILFTKKDKNQDIELLRSFYFEVYPNPDDISIDRNEKLDTETEIAWEINVYNAPLNDDSVKKLNNIIQVIDKDRSADKLMPMQEMYQKLLDEIVLPNGIMSVYVELIMSLLFFDENGVMCRYGGEPDHQIALKNIIRKCDPRLSIFYNFNLSAIAQILKDSDKILGAEHMYSDMLKLFDQ